MRCLVSLSVPASVHALPPSRRLEGGRASSHSPTRHTLSLLSALCSLRVLQLTTRVVPRHEKKWPHSVHAHECRHFFSRCARGLLARWSARNRVDGADVVPTCDVRESTFRSRK